MPFLLTLLVLLLSASAARADSLISAFGSVAPVPLACGDSLPIDTGTADQHWLCPKASDIGGLLITNNLSEVDPTTGRNNLRAAPLDSPTFTTVVNLPSVTQPENSAKAATTSFVKAQEFYTDASWVNQDPNNTCVHIAHQAEKVTGITGRVTAVAGTGATVAFNKVTSGTAVSSGVALTTGSLLADSNLNTNQALTLTATPANLLLAVGDAVCLTSNAGNFTTANGVVTVALVKQ